MSTRHKMAGDAFSAALMNLFSELKDYLKLERRFAMLTLAEKLTVLLSVVIIVVVLILLATQVIMYLMLAMAETIGAAVGNRGLGYLIAALLIAVQMGVFYAMRTKWVVNPIARFMKNLFNSTEP